MNTTKLHGVVVPVITPIDAQEDVDEAALRKLIRRLVRAGIHSIFMGGSAGEGPLLVDRQWRCLAEIAFDEVGGQVPLLGGVMDTSSRRVREKIKALKDIGYRYFVLTPTFYLSIRSPSEHIRLFGEAKEVAGDMEMIAYNIPQCTGAALTIDTLCELARRGWIQCCKESSGDSRYLMELLRRREDAGLSVLAGDEVTAGEALLAGANGIVPVCANYDPNIFLRLYQAGARGDGTEVAQVMRRVALLRDNLVLSGPCWLSGIKYAVAALGIGTGRPISPLEPVDPTRKARIDDVFLEDQVAQGQD